MKWYFYILFLFIILIIIFISIKMGEIGQFDKIIMRTL